MHFCNKRFVFITARSRVQAPCAGSAARARQAAVGTVEAGAAENRGDEGRLVTEVAPDQRTRVSF